MKEMPCFFTLRFGSLDTALDQSTRCNYRINNPSVEAFEMTFGPTQVTKLNNAQRHFGQSKD